MKYFAPINEENLNLFQYSMASFAVFESLLNKTREVVAHLENDICYYRYRICLLISVYFKVISEHFRNQKEKAQIILKFLLIF